VELTELKSVFAEQAKLWHEHKDAVDKRIAAVENQAAAATKRSLRPGGSRESIESKSIGQLVAEQYAEHKSLFERTGNLALEVKAAGDPLLTGTVGTIVSLNGSGVPGGVLGIQNLLPMPSMDAATAFEYLRYTGVEGAADVQSTEGTTKSALTPTITRIQQSAITIAGFVKASRQALDDRRELPVLVDTVLRRSIGTKIDDILTGGTGAFSGGLEALATAVTSLVYTDMADAVSEAVAAMQVAGFAPDAVALSPTDWLAIQVARGTTNDHPLGGSYLGALPESIRGLRVGVSPGLTAGKALVMDTSFIELAVVDGLRVVIGLDGNDFTKNLATMLGEVRVAPIFRATGAARLVTPLAA
jgi:HK97 family phage major capsid protein